MNPLYDLILAEVRRRGRVTFQEYMAWALYHPHHGYYATSACRTGRQGDFFTNVQAGPLFSRLLAAVLQDMWKSLGSGRWTLVELGGGDGALAESLLTAFQENGRDRGLSYHLVEASPKAREAARRRLSRFPRVKIWDSLESFEHVAGVEGCVFSNEFFDALPVHRVIQQGGALRELYVEADGDQLVERPGDLSTVRLERCLQDQGVALAEGQAAEICLALDDVFDELDRILSRGFLLTIDYGAASADLYDPSRAAGTLRAFRRHQVTDDPFAGIGESDITAHVDFSRLALLGLRRGILPLIYADQGPFFLSAGENLLRETVENARETPDYPSVARQIQQLLHPRSFGGTFRVLVQGKNVGRPDLAGVQSSRLHRLALPASAGVS
jgi:SAM-dependent MidA family methyltransferase